MSAVTKYGIENGQMYTAADGSGLTVQVIDADTYAYCDDVVVRNHQGNEYRIDAFKLAMVRYSLVK